MEDKDKKDDITLEDLMGIPAAEQKENEESENEESENEESDDSKSKEEKNTPSELKGVINSEKKDDNVDAGLVDDTEPDVEEEGDDPVKKGYEAQENEKKLKENIEGMADEEQETNAAALDEEVEVEDGDTDLKQKVVNVLKKFKGEAQALEQMRETNPEAYSSTLEVINVMLDLAKALGLCGGNSEEATSIEEDLGKSMILPTKQTTKHIPKGRRPVGSIDSKGREKTIDEAGDFSWVDRKKGVVKDPTGKIGSREDGR